jgi:hypothetical protein
MPDASVGPEVDAESDVERPEWFDIEMTDVQTGEPFTINDFAGIIVDRDGSAFGLPFSGVKDAESLQGVVEPLLYPDVG